MTNYHALLDRLETWRVASEERIALVTFNYDTFVESAALDQLRLTLQPCSLEVDLNATWNLFKLHGSIDWSRKVNCPLEWDRVSSERVVIRGAGRLEFTREYIQGRVGREISAPAVGTAYVPAIAVPARSKPEFECPVERIDALKQLIPSVDRILIVGWRGGERQFLDLLKGSMASGVRGWVVNGNLEEATESAETFEDGTGLPRGAVEPSNLEGFSKMLERGSRDGEALLNQVLS